MLLESIIVAKLLPATFSLTNWGINTMTTVCVMISGMLVKGCYDDYRSRTTDERTRGIIEEKSKAPNFKPIYIKEYVDNHSLVTQLERILQSDIGGLFVLGAPCGSGKTTYLGKAIEKFQSEYSSRKVYYLNGISEDTFSALGVPDGRFSEFLPSGSVVILDQAESTIDPSPKVFNLLIQLAVQSRNSKVFHTIIAVSSPSLMEKILELNGGEKIYSIAPTSLLKWDEKKQLELAEKLLPQWSPETRQSLVNKVKSSESCGILFSLANQLDGFPEDFDEGYSNVIEQVNKRSNEWKEFARFDKRAFKLARSNQLPA